MKFLLNSKLFCILIFLVAGQTSLTLALPQDITRELDGLPSKLPVGETAVIVVDLQNDFTEAGKGSLPVSGTDNDYVLCVGEATKILKDRGYGIYATQDWHPSGHVSHAATHKLDPFTLHKGEMVWPIHCVQGSRGAEILLPPDLDYTVVQKGTSKDFDSYSGFKDNNGDKTQLEQLLKQKGIKNLIVYGIATDYCVQATVLDALACGFSVYVLDHLSRGVNSNATENALKKMKSSGAVIIPDI